MLTQDQIEYYEDLLGEQLNPNEKGECVIHCPFPDHSDTTPSFSLNLEKEVWQCFGCSEKGHINILEFKITGHKTIAATYQYEDEQGRPVFEIVKYHPKSFTARQPDGTENLKGVKRVLYHLPEVVSAKTVYFTEGEKDSDRLRELGLKDKHGNDIAVTTNPFGAGKFKDEYSPYFKGKDVVIFSDTDPEGLKHSEAVAKSISKHARSVRMIREYLDYDMKDVSQFLDNHPIEKLHELIDEATKFEAASDKESFDLVQLSDVEAEETRFLEYPYIPSGGLSLMEGDPGSGKTWFALALAALITRGSNLDSAIHGHRPNNVPRNVVFITAEDDIKRTIRPRFEKLGGDCARLYTFRSNNDLTLSQTGRIETYLKKCSPSLLIFDPFQAFLGAKVDMHRSNETRPVLSAIGALAEKYDCAILLIRHLTKGSVGSKPIYRGMGSIDITGNARSVLLTNVHPDNPETKVVCHIKHNLSGRGKSICYSIGGGVFQWLGYSDLTAEDISLALAASARPSTKREQAEDFLLRVLSGGKKRATEVLELAAQEGHSPRTIERAKKNLNVDCHPDGFQGPHVWELNTTPNKNGWRPVGSLEETGMSADDDAITI